MFVEAVDGGEVEVAILIDGIPAVSAIRPIGGMTWATNATIYVPTGDAGGLVFKIEGADSATPVAILNAETL